MGLYNETGQDNEMGQDNEIGQDNPRSWVFEGAALKRCARARHQP